MAGKHSVCDRYSLIWAGQGTNRSASDVLPWQCLTRYPDDCRNAIFVDVDFSDLMLKKRQVVLNTVELTGPLENVETSDDDPILLRSDRYFQVGCDLRDPDTLGNVLATIADLSQARLLFVAEVSITYMETEAADALIKWASSLGQCMSPAIHPRLRRVCLLARDH